MACNKVCFVDEVGRFDRRFAETQVGNGQAARFLRVIVEVSLYVHIGVVADDLDGVFVCTARTVCAQAPEFAACDASRSGVRVLFDFEGQVCHVVNDTDGETFFLCIFVNRDDVSRCGVFRA